MNINNRPTHVFLKCAQSKSEWVSATPLIEIEKDEHGARQFKSCFPSDHANTVKMPDSTVVHHTMKHKSDEAFIVRLDWSEQDSAK
ncbi:MAG: hypothetical protein ACAI35_08325 [Candidatus Methylacidiphilales bacterium]|nr:hypothetical protein [Candidatus Methylacidiphilales bacterium]